MQLSSTITELSVSCKAWYFKVEGTHMHFYKNKKKQECKCTNKLNQVLPIEKC